MEHIKESYKVEGGKKTCLSFSVVTQPEPFICNELWSNSPKSSVWSQLWHCQFKKKFASFELQIDFLLW